MRLGKFILKQRLNLNLSQDEVARNIGVSRPTYRQIEEDQRDITITEAEKLAGVFGTTLFDLLNRVEQEHTVNLKDKKASVKPDTDVRVEKKDIEKFRQVLLYILNKVGGKPNVGETVLHKLLYFIDFDYYEKYEENLMGAIYIKNNRGPTSVELKSIVDAMQKQREIEIIKKPYFEFEQKKYLALKKPDLTNLSAQEISHIDWVLSRLSDKSAKEIATYSHGDMPWRAAKQGEKIECESVFYRDERYSVREYDEL